MVFDPLAVLLLIAANQSLMRRFPPEPPKPQEVIDLEKPDEEGIDLKWNEMMDKSDAAAKMEEATEQLKNWKEKLEAFNQKVPKPDEKPVEIIQQDKEDSTIPYIDLVGQKKTEDKEIVPVLETDPIINPEWEKTLSADPKEPIKDGFDPDEVMFDLDPPKPKVDVAEQLERFKKREEEEQKALEEYARKAKEEQEREQVNKKEYAELDIEGFRPGKVVKKEATVEEALKMPESESVQTPIQERIKPDFTEVIEPEAEVKPPKPTLSNWQRAELLDNFHKEHGNFQDSKDYVQNEEQGETTNWKKIKTKLTTEEDYHLRMEQRIEDLMAKVDAGEIKLEDLTPEDRQVIIEIKNQNEV